MGKLVDAMHEG